MVTLKIVSSLDKLFYDACDPPMLSDEGIIYGEQKLKI